MHRLAGWRIAATLMLMLAAPTMGANEDGNSTRGGRVDGLSRDPNTVLNELRAVDEVDRPMLQAPGWRRILDPLFGVKADIQNATGLLLGINYTAGYQLATESLGPEQQAAGGLIDILGIWTQRDPNAPRRTLIGFRAEDRHRICSRPAVSELGTIIGSGWPTATGFGAFPFSLAELWWKQHIINDRLEFGIGKMSPFAVYDFFYLKNPKKDFIGGPVAFNSSIAWPEFGLGAAVRGRPTLHSYLAAGVHDANGKATRAGFDTLFDKGELFIAAEAGWDPMFNKGAGDYHATFWYQERRENAGTPESWGFSVIAQQYVGDLLPFIRYGFSDGDAAPLHQMVTVGVGSRMPADFADGAAGVALSWGQPSDNSLGDQYGAEAYYRVKLAPYVSVSPIVQVIVNPSRYTERNAIGVFSLRMRMRF